MLAIGADHAFIDGIRLAVIGGALLAALAAVIVFRNLPREAAHGTAVESSVTAVETTAELGLAGVEPAFAGDARDDRHS